VTGWRSRERLAAPVAETRDVTFSRSRSCRSGPDEPLFRNYRQDHHRAGSRPCALGSGLGDRPGESIARHAEERGDPAPLLRRERVILWGAVVERGFAGQSWLTFRQALSLGGNVRKGERGTTVVYADRFIPDDERKRAERDGDEPGAIPFLERFTVFNTDQCENLAGLITAPQPVSDGLILPQAEALIAATGADFRMGGDRAFYSPAHDYVQVPRPDAYFEPINWHRTVLHELGHWVGHPSRLARNLTGAFGSALYAKEELIAEMTSAFVCASLGIPPTVRHADYIGSWVEVLREDDHAIVRAASAASKAADYLLAFRPDPSEPVDAIQAADEMEMA
jgi:antirestriction protein ArdC